jgi:O-acetyl-ADP-ribose deacetylase (regulator of RNase III)
MNEIKGNLLDIVKGIIVHGCNCQGVMGSGVALAVKSKYPNVFEEYRRQVFHKALGENIACANPKFVGYELENLKFNLRPCKDLPARLVVVNALTQFTFGTETRQVDYDAISSCFAQVRLLAKEYALPVYYPLIGAGLGGGDWAEIAPRIEHCLEGIKHTLVKL